MAPRWQRIGKAVAVIGAGAAIGLALVAFAWTRQDAPSSFWGFVREHLEPLATFAAFLAAVWAGIGLRRQIVSQDEQLRKLAEDVETAQKSLAVERIDRLDQRFLRLTAFHRVFAEATGVLKALEVTMDKPETNGFTQHEFGKRWAEARDSLPYHLQLKLQTEAFLKLLLDANTAYSSYAIKVHSVSQGRGTQEDVAKERAKAEGSLKEAQTLGSRIQQELERDLQRLRKVLDADEALLLE